MAIGKQEQHVRKASHCGSKQHKSSPEKITVLVTISKYYQLFTSFTSIIRGHSPRSLHRDHSVTACSRHIYMYCSVRLCAHSVCGELGIHPYASGEVAITYTSDSFTWIFAFVVARTDTTSIIDAFAFSIFWTCSLNTDTNDCKCLNVSNRVRSKKIKKKNVSEKELAWRIYSHLAGQ